MSVVIVFLGMQVHDTTNRTKDAKRLGQDNVTHAARLLVQSATQTHPFLSYQHALEAKFTLDRTIRLHGGLHSAAKELRIDVTRLQKLRRQVDEQTESVQDFLMERVLSVHPELDVDLNADAGLVSSRRRRKSKKN
jgi:single-stranded DNA-specific DHH superfamily exonuclease